MRATFHAFIYALAALPVLACTSPLRFTRNLAPVRLADDCRPGAQRRATTRTPFCLGLAWRVRRLRDGQRLTALRRVGLQDETCRCISFRR